MALYQGGGVERFGQTRPIRPSGPDQFIDTELEMATGIETHSSPEGRRDCLGAETDANHRRARVHVNVPNQSEHVPDHRSFPMIINRFRTATDDVAVIATGTGCKTADIPHQLGATLTCRAEC